MAASGCGSPRTITLSSMRALRLCIIACMNRWSAVVLTIVTAGAWISYGQRAAAPKFPSHPDFKQTPEVPAMPKALMKLPRTKITRAKFPAVDFHFHGRGLATADDYRKMVKLMDETGIGVICNMDGGFGRTFDQNMKTGEPYKDRIIHFARVDFNGINDPGWSQKTAAELERCFRAGAAGLKINKVLGLDLKNPDGTYIQSDDPRFDPIWAMCASTTSPS
jgi:hypothetical protein